jgi:hypothetical protein
LPYGDDVVKFYPLSGSHQVSVRDLIMSLVWKRAIKRVLNHCKEYVVTNALFYEGDISTFENLDPESLSEQFIENLRPYLVDDELITFRNDNAEFLCRKTDVLIKRFTHYELFSDHDFSGIEDACQVLGDLYQEKRLTVGMDKQLESIGMLFCQHQRVAKDSEYLLKHIGLIVIAKYLLDKHKVNFDDSPVEMEMLLTVYFAAAIRKPSSLSDSVKKTNTRKRAELIQSIMSFSLDGYGDTSFSTTELVSLATDTSKLTDRLVSTPYQQVLLVLSSSGEDLLSSVFLKRFYLIVLNRWIEVMHPLLHSNVTNMSVNGIENFRWLMSLCDSPIAMNALREFSNTDTPNEKIKGQYWGGKFEKDLRDNIVKIEAEPAQIFSLLLFNNLAKAIKAFENNVHTEKKEWDELLEFLYYGNTDGVPLLVSSTKEYNQAATTFAKIAELYVVLNELPKKEREAVKAELQQESILEVVEALPAEDIVPILKKTIKAKGISKLVFCLMEDELEEVEL